MADASRDTLRGLLIEDPRLRSESSIWTAESAGLTQAGRHVGRPPPSDTTSGLSATFWRGIRHLLAANLHCACLPRTRDTVVEREKLVVRHPTGDLHGCPTLRVAAPK